MAIATAPPELVSRQRLTAQQIVPVVLVVALFAAGALGFDGYLTKNGLMSILILSSFLGLAAMGQTLCIIVGGVDLSVPAVIGLANVLITSLYGDGWNFWVASLYVAGFAVLIGAANAIAARVLRVNPIITTLGTGLIVFGGVLSWGHANITGSVPAGLTEAVSVIGTTGPIPVPTIVLVWLAMSVVMILFQRRTRIGREVFFTGANAEAAALARVRSTYAWIVAFVISALSAALVGVLLAGYSSMADHYIGQPYLFTTITAVVVGGTSLLGGQGGYGNTIIGVLIVSQLTFILVGMGLGAELQEVLLGCLIMVLVSLYGREQHVSTRI